MPVVAITAMVAVDLLAVALSGSFWTPYLFVPIPGARAGPGLLVAHGHLDRGRHLVTPRRRRLRGRLERRRPGRLDRRVGGGRVPVEVRTGQAIAAAGRPATGCWSTAAAPTSSGRAGASSPYPHLWSLPMRTLDPGLEDLAAVLTGSDPPTWFVEAVYINTWSELGTRPSSGR